MISIPYFVMADWMCIKDNVEANIYDYSIILTVALTHTLTMIKGFFISYKKEFFDELFEALESKEIRYEACEEKGYIPKMLTKQYRKDAKLMRTIFYGFSWFAGVAAFFPTVSKLIMVAIDGEKNSMPEKLPFFTWVPFPSNTIVTFILGVLYQAYPAFYHIVG